MGDSSVCYLLGEVLISGAFGLSGSGREDGLFLRCDLRTNKFEGNFIKGFLRRWQTIVFLKSPKSETPAARERLVGCPGASGFPGG